MDSMFLIENSSNDLKPFYFITGGARIGPKAHHLRPETLRKLYPRFDDFVQVLEVLIPNGMFRNEYVQRHIFGKRGPEVHGRVFKAFQLTL
jgi:L-gulonolactone oxidase